MCVRQVKGKLVWTTYSGTCILIKVQLPVHIPDRVASRARGVKARDNVALLILKLNEIKADRESEPEHGNNEG